MPTNNNDEYELGALGWGTNIAGGAASGALTGAQIPGAGPIGAAVGGVLGGGLGALQSVMQQKALDAEAARQAELEAALEKSAADYDLFRMGSNLATGQRGAESELAARQLAARGNLTAGSSAALQQAAAADSAQAAATQQAEMGIAAQQAKLAQQGMILDQYRTAQDLANGTQPGADIIGSIGSIGTNLAELAGKAQAGWGQAPVAAPAAEAATTARQAPTQDSQIARTLASAEYPSSPDVNFKDPWGFNPMSGPLSMGNGSLPGLLGEPGAAPAFAPSALPTQVAPGLLAPPTSPYAPSGWQPGAGVVGTGVRGGASAVEAQAKEQQQTTEAAAAGVAPTEEEVAALKDYGDPAVIRSMIAGAGSPEEANRIIRDPNLRKGWAATRLKAQDYLQRQRAALEAGGAVTPEALTTLNASPDVQRSLRVLFPDAPAARFVVKNGLVSISLLE